MKRNRVSCYRSANLMEWEFCNHVLTLDAFTRSIAVRTDLSLVSAQGKGTNIERPKILYNAATQKFVMWMHWENGTDYKAARCAVATCDRIDGDYVYLGSFNPLGCMSRDCTLFQDEDGTAYFISAARDNADIHIYRLSEDYLSIDEHIRTLWPGQYREAPALFKKDGVYFMLTSGCTGWKPNQGKFAYSLSLSGKWSPLLNFGDATTYSSQSTFVLPFPGNSRTLYLYIGDRWDASDYHNSTYVMLPLQFSDERSLRLEWSPSISIDLKR